MSEAKRSRAGVIRSTLLLIGSCPVALEDWTIEEARLLEAELEAIELAEKSAKPNWMRYLTS